VTVGLPTAEPELLEHEGLLRPPRAAPTGRAGPRTWLVVLVVAVVWSLLRAGVGRRELVNGGGWTLVGRFLDAALHPELSRPFLRLTWEATWTTLSYAVLGTALSVGVGLVLGVVASEGWWQGRAGPGGRRRRHTRWLLLRAVLSLPRGVHEVVWGLLLVTVLGLDPLVAILAIAIPYGAITAKVYAELFDETPRRALDAVRATGAGRIQSFAYTVLPQSVPDMVSYGFYRFECSIRAAAILGIIGAGGLGFQLALSFQSLRYGEMWTLIYALVLVSGLADLWSSALRRRTRSTLPPGPAGPGGAGPRPGRDRLAMASALGAALLVLVALWHLRVDVTSLWADKARTLAAGVAASSWPPDLGPANLSRLASLSLETLEMSLVATAVASLGGAAFAFAAAGRARSALGRAAGLASRGVLLLCRAIPPPVWALVLLFVLFPGPLPGALALGAYNFGILGRLMAEAVENLDERPARALRAQGASGRQALLYGVGPAALPRFVAYSLYRWEVTVRETVVVGLVGAGGLGRLLAEQLAAFDYGGVAATLLALVLLTFVGDMMGSAVRRSLRDA
jgi:phosphonate transport system permease protein